jgi:LacI family transcriptional regulator
VKKKLSIKDIARELNVSPTAVSFILNGKAEEKRISKEVVKKVEKFIQKTGYKPNSLARSLRTGKTNTIALMIEDIANPFFANIARLIEEKAYKSGYKIIYSSTDNDPVIARELIQMYRERHVDGYIITPSEGIEEELNALLEADLPVVLFDRYVPGVDCDVVLINNEQSAYKATRHLVEEGYRNIAFITLNSLQSQMQERLNGYEKALAEAGLPSRVKELSYTSATHNNDLIRYITAFLNRNKGLDAVLFGTNYIGVNGLKAIRTMGLAIPDDLAVVSFDDHDVFQLNSPDITAIAQPIEKIAEKLITVLLGKLTAGNKSKGLRKMELPAELVVRHSSVKGSNADKKGQAAGEQGKKENPKQHAGDE